MKNTFQIISLSVSVIEKNILNLITMTSQGRQAFPEKRQSGGIL